MRDALLLARDVKKFRKRLVDMMRTQREVVAMSGDRMNNARELRKAYIDIAVGFGTAVWKEVSSLGLSQRFFGWRIKSLQQLWLRLGKDGHRTQT